jgi:hypothetical protein
MRRFLAVLLPALLLFQLRVYRDHTRTTLPEQEGASWFRGLVDSLCLPFDILEKWWRDSPVSYLDTFFDTTSQLIQSVLERLGSVLGWAHSATEAADSQTKESILALMPPNHSENYAAGFWIGMFVQVGIVSLMLLVWEKLSNGKK